MQTWDYRVVTCDHPNLYEDELKRQGDRGWELVNSVMANVKSEVHECGYYERMFFMFKRPKDESGAAAAITFGGNPVSREFTAPSG